MTDQPVDPANPKSDEAEPSIAADDAGASALAERVQKEADDLAHGDPAGPHQP